MKRETAPGLDDMPIEIEESAADRLVKSMKKKAAQDNLNHAKLEDEELSNTQQFKARDKRWSWLGHVLRMHRLVRQVLLNCVKPAVRRSVPSKVGAGDTSRYAPLFLLPAFDITST